MGFLTLLAPIRKSPPSRKHSKVTIPHKGLRLANLGNLALAPFENGDFLNPFCTSLRSQQTAQLSVLPNLAFC